MIEFRKRGQLYYIYLDGELIGELYKSSIDKEWKFYVLSKTINGILIYGYDVSISKSITKAKRILKEVL